MADATRARATGERKAGSDPRKLLESNLDVIEQAIALVAAIERAGSDWRSFLCEQVASRPYASLAVGAGLGYVLGAGVSPAAIRRIAGAGGQMVLMALVKDLLRSESPDTTAAAEPSPGCGSAPQRSERSER